MRQILTNLIGNAIKFTERGQVWVQVSPVDEVGAGDTVLLRFSVRDTGIGIPADRFDRLFNRFSQVDASTTRRFGGTGLGLAISRQLAERMGGAIGVRSEQGRGSEFWFTARLELQKADAPEIAPAGLKDVRVLVVEDNTTGRDILCAQLTRWGMRTTAVADGYRALEALSRAAEGNAFQLVLIDAGMPGMDGLTLGRAVRDDPRFVDLPLILMTPMARGPRKSQVAEPPFADFLTKPIRSSEMKDTLARCLVRRQPPSVNHVNRQPSQARQHRFEGCTARILVAEDNPTNQQVALAILKRLGLWAQAVDNGADAVKAVKANPYDVILMDVQMPEMDGLEATRAIRKLNREGICPGLTIIALTAHAMRGDAEACRAAGMDDYLTKPVSPIALSEMLEEDRQSNGRTKASATRVNAVPSPRSRKVLDTSACMELAPGSIEAKYLKLLT